jgi:hypothetical protein
MIAQVGDTIVVESEKAAQAHRTGVIEEVLGEDPPRYRVRWEDERVTVFVPSAGSSRIEHRETSKA